MKSARFKCGAAICGLIAGAAGPAFAQDETAERDEIVVSARKTEETLQEAPISVSALTAQQIRERGIESIDDLARFAPGLSFSQAFGRSTDRPVIRGQSNVLANVQFGVESGTAYFIDGIYYPTTLQSIDFNLIRQVEVIRGPQSALYGRNTYAGAINFITIDPSEEHMFRVRGRYAEDQESEVSVTAGGPIIDGVLGAAVTARYYEYGGAYTNTLTGKNVGDEETWAVNGIVSFTPTSNFDAKLRIGYQEDNDGPLALFLQGSGANNCLPGFRSNFYRSGGALSATPGGSNDNQYYCGVIAPGPVALNTNPIGPAANQADGTAFDGIEREILTVGLVANWEPIENVTVTSQTGWREETEKFGTDSDHSDANIFTGNPATTEPLFANTSRDDIKDWSQELRIQWEPIDRLRLLVGGFYYDQEIVGREITKQSGETGVQFGGPSLDPGCTAAATCSDRSGVQNWAVFGLAEFDITETLSLTGEVRYMEETKSLEQFNGLGVQTFPPTGVSNENTENYVTPRFTLNWQATEDALLYFIYAEGVKPGGFNGSSGVSVGLPTYLPETADSFEIGAKTQWWDGLLTANLSAYLLNSSDVQLTTAVPTTTAVNSIVTNQGQGKTWGLEAEFFLTPSDNWDFTANYAWTRPEFTEGCDQDQWILTSGGGVFFGEGDVRNTSFNNVFGGVATCDITGKRFPLTSEHQASVAGQYTVPLRDNSEFFINANGSYESSKFVQVHNLAETGDAFLLGAQLGVRGEGWQFNVFGRNLTNEDSIVLATRWFDLRYGGTTGPGGAVGLGRIVADGGSATTATTGSPRGFFGTLRRPRQFGVELTVEF